MSDIVVPLDEVEDSEKHFTDEVHDFAVATPPLFPRVRQRWAEFKVWCAHIRDIVQHITGLRVHLEEQDLSLSSRLDVLALKATFLLDSKAFIEQDITVLREQMQDRFAMEVQTVAGLRSDFEKAMAADKVRLDEQEAHLKLLSHMVNQLIASNRGLVHKLNAWEANTPTLKRISVAVNKRAERLLAAQAQKAAEQAATLSPEKTRELLDANPSLGGVSAEQAAPESADSFAIVGAPAGDPVHPGPPFP